MILSVFLDTDALGAISHCHFYVSPSDVDKGFYVDSLFSESYRKFVKAIYVKSLNDGEAVEISSEYGSRKYPSDKEAFWGSDKIGLSYAFCEVTIRLIPEMMPTWDILTVRHEGATEVFQREEILDGVNLGEIHPRRDGNLIPWLNAMVSGANDTIVSLRTHRTVDIVLGHEPVVDGKETYNLVSFSTIIYEWDELEEKPIKFIVDTEDLIGSIENADAALRLADEIEEQQPEMLEIVAKYMGYAADLGSEDAQAWLRDYYEVDDSRHHPYV